MAANRSLRVRLDYPLSRVQEPLVYRLIKDYALIPDIRRGSIDPNAGGMLVLRIEGDPENLDAGLDYLRRQGVLVTLMDAVEDWSI